MNTRRVLLFTLLVSFAVMLNAPAAQVTLTVDAGKVTGRIDEKIYGHFLEHIYHSCNGGLWGEMIWNRSFEWTSAQDQAKFAGKDPLSQNKAPKRAAPKASSMIHFWELFGEGEHRIVKENALNGEYCVELRSSGKELGMRQRSLCLRTGDVVRGSLWARGTATDGLIVRLLDETKPVSEIRLGTPQAEWKEFPFEYTPAATVKNATIQIGMAGAGDVFVDQVSMMADSSRATGGFRPDLLQAIAALRPPIIRWPGGSFVHDYRWKDGIGLQAKRGAYPKIAWEDRDTNSFGTDEFIAFCRKVGAEPVIVVNINARGKVQPDTAYVREAAEWVEYCNGSPESPWGKVRAANGHPEPYGVRYWEVDNEIWNLKPEVYARDIKTFAAALKKVDPAIKLLACGSGSMGNLREHWPEGDIAVIEQAAREVDYLSIHHYELPERYAVGTFRKAGLLERLAGRIAQSANPDLKFFLSEWNAQSTDWRTGLYAGGILNYFERTPQVGMASPALFLRHVSAKGWDNAFINFDQTGWFPAPNYVVMKLWRDHYAPNLLACAGDQGGLNLNATKTDQGDRLFIKAVNPGQEQARIEIQIKGGFKPAKVALEVVAPGALEARNTMAEPDKIKPEPGHAALANGVLSFAMPPLSAGVVSVERE